MEIVVITCDAFQYVVPLCMKYMHGAWTDCGEVTTIVTNTGSHELQQLHASGKVHSIVHVGADQGWSNNMIEYLNISGRLVDNTPFLLLLEDYIVYDINWGIMNGAINSIDNYDDVGMVRLVPIPGPTLPWHDHRGRSSVIGSLDKTTHASYCMSLQAAMWRPRTLLEVLEPDLNPWKTEGRGSRRIANGRICQNTQFLCTYKNAVSYKNLLRRGKPDEDVLSWLRSRGDAIPRRTG